MAEIHVEPKKHSSGINWIWIVAVLLIAAVIYYLVSRNNSNNSTAPPANTTGYVNLPIPAFSNAAFL